MSILEDPTYKRCLSLAQESKGPMKFGAVVYNREYRIIGSGWNRRIQKGDTPIRMGYCNHAEVNAMNMALARQNISRCYVYVAGYFEDGKLYLPSGKHFSCNRCPKYFQQYGISGVFIPNLDGWKFMTTAMADQCGRDWFREKEDRTDIGKSDLTIEGVIG